MTLVLDERSDLRGKPGLHVFIAGASLYRHLPGGGGKPTDNSYGMQQLSSTALTGYKVYRWLLDNKGQLPLPLATVRLLLSPSPAELAVEPKMENLTDACTRANFAAEAKQWRKDAGSSRDEFTFFYFAGHGVQRKKDDAVMLLEDFGNPDEGPLASAVTIDNLFNGMAPPASPTEQIAQRQIYFVDACRIAPSEFRAWEWLDVSGIWGVELSGSDDRYAPIFFAAIPGTKAYALSGEQTLFSKALLACLNGSGAEALEEDTDGQVRWGVTVHSLNEALESQVGELNVEHEGNQKYTLSGLVRNTVLHYLERPPEVDIVLEIDPTEALPFVRLEVTDPQDAGVWNLEPIDPHPYENKLPAGYYRISAKIVNPPQPPYVDYAKWREVKPPRCPVKARLSP